MTRPTFSTVDHGNEDWDADVDANFDKIDTTGPCPVFQVTASTSLAAFTTAYPAASYDRCIAFLNESTFGYCYVWSDGTVWRIIGHPNVFDLTDAATITVDAKVIRHMGTGRVTLAGNRTLGQPSNPAGGQIVIFEVIQDGTGSRTLAFHADYVFTPANPQPILQRTAAQRDFLMFQYDATSTKWYLINHRVLPRVVALTDAATVAVDAALIGHGGMGTVTLGGNRTLGNPTGTVADGHEITIRVTQDGTGTRTLAYDTEFAFSTDIPSPTLSTAAGKVDYLKFKRRASASKWDFIAKNFGF